MRLRFTGNSINPGSDLKNVFIELNDKEYEQGIKPDPTCEAIKKILIKSLNGLGCCEYVASDNHYGHIVYDSFYIEKNDIKQAFKQAKQLAKK